VALEGGAGEGGGKEPMGERQTSRLSGVFAREDIGDRESARTVSVLQE